MPKNQPRKTHEVNPKTVYIGFFCVLLVIAGIILYSAFSGNDTTNNPKPTTHAADYDAHAAWVMADGELAQEAVHITSDGDTVKFELDGKTHTLQNTEIIYWATHEKNLSFQSQSTHYEATMMLPSGDTVVVICYEYEDDPNCSANPAYLLYDDTTCYHVAASNVTIETHNTGAVSIEGDDNITSIETDDEMTNITIIE